MNQTRLSNEINNIFWEIRQLFLHVFKKAIIIFSSLVDKIILCNVQRFQFLLLTYRFESAIFRRKVAPDVLRSVPWCGSLQNMFV